LIFQEKVDKRSSAHWTLKSEWVKEHKGNFLLCHYFARRKKRINSNPSHVWQNESRQFTGKNPTASPTLRRERSEAVSNRITRHEDCRFSLHPQPLENTREFFYFAITLLGKASEMIRIHRRLGTICYLLIASYSLPRNLCHIRALEDMFPWCFPFCQGMKNRIRGRVTDRIECYGVFVSPCRFSWPFMMGQQTRDFRWFTAKNIRTSFGQSQKIEIDKALTLEHYTPNKVFVSPCSCP